MSDRLVTCSNDRRTEWSKDRITAHVRSFITDERRNQLMFNIKKRKSNEKKTSVLVAVCNQKGGVGKSTMTIMLAGYYHYLKGLNVAVIDCDYPQYSLVRMKERDMRTVEHSEYFKQLMVSQYERINKKAYTIVGSKAENARDAAEKLKKNGDYDLIVVDLPGTVNSSGVIQHHREYGLCDYTDYSRPYCNAEQPLVLHHCLGLCQSE